MSTALIQKALVAQFLTELFERRSDEPLQHLITADFRLNGTAGPATERGVAALQPLLAALRAGLDRPRIRIDDLVVEENRVAARYVFEAEHGAPQGTRRPIRLPGMLMARVERGRVAECWWREDPMAGQMENVAGVKASA